MNSWGLCILQVVPNHHVIPSALEDAYVNFNLLVRDERDQVKKKIQKEIRIEATCCLRQNFLVDGIYFNC